MREISNLTAKLGSETSEEDYREVYEQMRRVLTPTQQQVVNAAYGLNQTPQMGAAEYRRVYGIPKADFPGTLKSAHARLSKALASSG